MHIEYPLVVDHIEFHDMDVRNARNDVLQLITYTEKILNTIQASGKEKLQIFGPKVVQLRALAYSLKEDLDKVA